MPDKDKFKEFLVSDLAHADVFNEKVYVPGEENRKKLDSHLDAETNPHETSMGNLVNNVHDNTYHDPNLAQDPHGNSAHFPNFAECPHGNECHDPNYLPESEAYVHPVTVQCNAITETGPDIIEHGNDWHSPNFAECPHGNECHDKDYITSDDIPDYADDTEIIVHGNDWHDPGMVERTGDTMTGQLNVNAKVLAEKVHSTVEMNIQSECYIGHNDENAVSGGAVNANFGGVYVPAQMDSSPWDGIINRGGPSNNLGARWKYDNGTYMRQNADHWSLFFGGTRKVTIDNNGHISKNSSDFLIPHPSEEGKQLRHGVVESPKYELIYRGTVTLENGQTEVDIDSECNLSAGTFNALTQNAEVVSLHNKTGFGRLKGTVTNGKVSIICEDSTSDEVAWMVIAERADDQIKQIHTTDEQGRLIPESKEVSREDE